MDNNQLKNNMKDFTVLIELIYYTTNGKEFVTQKWFTTWKKLELVWVDGAWKIKIDSGFKDRIYMIRFNNVNSCTFLNFIHYADRTWIAKENNRAKLTVEWM